MRLEVALLGLLLFVALAVSWSRPRRSAPIRIACLTLLVMAWLFVATLAWGAGHPAIREFSFGGSAGLELGFAFCGVAALGCAIRCAVTGQNTPACAAGAVSAIAFVGWSVFVAYSPATAIVLLIAGLAICLIPVNSQGGLIQLPYPLNLGPTTPEIQDVSSARPARLSVLAQIIVTVVDGTWFLYAVLVLFIPNAENTPGCGCWADNDSSSLYWVQILLMLIGGPALFAAAATFGRRHRPLTGLFAGAGAAALATWVLIIIPTTHVANQ